MKNIALKFDSKAIIKLLGVQLYDTPMAMLRENVQNGFDAVKERQKKDADYKNPCVRVTIIDRQVIVSDNGIGMDQDNLEQNYWTAGKSGKNNEEARQAGVVGHFGIGALANFGVCSSLDVETRKVGVNRRYRSHADRERLDGEQITIEEMTDESNNYGTTVTATLDDENRFAVEDAKNYLQIFVQYVDIPVYLNDECLSQQPQGITEIPTDAVSLADEYKDGYVSFSFHFVFQNYQPMNPQLQIEDITLYGRKEPGMLYLTKKKSSLFGLNNGFGLASMNIYSQFGFGGFANFPFLEPTAGREAIAKNCTERVQTLLNKVEELWADTISQYIVADGYRDFLAYVNGHFRRTLVKNIRIKTEGTGKDDMALGDIDPKDGGGFYKGQDSKILESYKSTGKPVYRVSQENPRRKIQLTYLRKIGIPELSDSVQITHVLGKKDIDNEEFMLLAEIRRTIEDDYILDNFDVRLAVISHDVQIMVNKEEGRDFVIYISRDSGDVKTICKTYKENYLLFTPLVKDFVRTALYRQFADYIPKSKQDRAAYIDAAYQKRKEELIIRETDVSEEELLFKKFQNNEITASQFIDRVKKQHRAKQEQVVTRGQVEDVENVVKTAALSANTTQAVPKAVREELEDMAQPPIMELDNPTDKKLLKTENQTFVLHYHTLFIGLSNNMVRDYRSFFMLPHTTKVIWSTHRIIYIFTEYTGQVSLYYEMELTKKLPNKMTGGKSLVSTTIITKNKIFVPVPEDITSYFDLRRVQELKFFVHFDKVNG